MDEREAPGRGQQKVVVNSKTPSSGNPLHSCGCLILLIIVMGIRGLLSDGGSTSSSGGYSVKFDDPLISELRGPAPSRPQGSYAAFAAKDEKTHDVFVFKEDYIELHVVTSEDDIPSEDKDVAWRPQQQRSGPESDIGLLIPLAAPIILHGDVDLTAGPIAEYDQWEATYQTVNGNVVNIQTLYDGTSSDEVRGPPKARRIFVVGSVRTIKTPDAFDASHASITLMDLRPDEKEFETYIAQKRVYDYHYQPDPRRDDPYAEHEDPHAHEYGEHGYEPRPVEVPHGI